MDIKDDVIGDVEEVEVRAHIIRTALGKPVLGYGPCESGENLVNIDHVNRLASDRDGLLVEIVGYQKERSFWVSRNDALHAQIGVLQSELTKARELLVRCQPRLSHCSLLDDVRDFLAQESPPTAKDLTKKSHNQCDGCQAGIPIEVNQYGTPLHRMGFEGKYPDYMACTAKVYLKD